MLRAISVLSKKSRGGGAHLAPTAVMDRWRRFIGAGGCDAGPVTPVERGSIDLTWRDSKEILSAFDCADQVMRVLGDLADAVRSFENVLVNSGGRAVLRRRENFSRLAKLTRSAWHIYAALSASALDRCGFEKVIGVSYADLGDLIVTAIDVLEWAEAQHG